MVITKLWTSLSSQVPSTWSLLRCAAALSENCARTGVLALNRLPGIQGKAVRRRHTHWCHRGGAKERFKRGRCYRIVQKLPDTTPARPHLFREILFPVFILPARIAASRFFSFP